jgi:uncharacterized protein
MENWASLFRLAGDAAQQEAQAIGSAPAYRFIWHGGEPLLLGLDYFQQVLELQQQILGQHPGRVQNLVQTNLYAFDEPLIRYLIEENFTFGVSYDGVPGVRVSAGGRPTESRVLDHVEKLEALGGRYAFIVVVGGHNAQHLSEIYDWATRHHFRLRLLPMFAGPASRPMDGLRVSDTSLVDALFALFKRWLDDGGRIDVLPFQRYLNTVTHYRLGFARSGRAQAPGLAPIIAVAPDGRLFPPWADKDTDPEVGRLGQSWREIRASDAFRRANEKVVDHTAKVCGACVYYGACSGAPLVEAPGFDSEPDCTLEAPLLRKIDAWFDEIGFERLIAENDPESELAGTAAHRQAPIGGL